jgi:hypothetical protein
MWQGRHTIVVNSGAIIVTGEAINFSDQSTVWSARGGVRMAF